MNSNVLTQTIVTGSDPRGLPEFSAIREEINKASHPSQPELNWKLVESLALAILKPTVWIYTPPPTIRLPGHGHRDWRDSAKVLNCWRQW